MRIYRVFYILIFLAIYAVNAGATIIEPVDGATYDAHTSPSESGVTIYSQTEVNQNNLTVDWVEGHTAGDDGYIYVQVTNNYRDAGTYRYDGSEGVQQGIGIDAAVPEPSTMLLAAIGLSGLFYAGSRRRKSA